MRRSIFPPTIPAKHWIRIPKSAKMQYYIFTRKCSIFIGVSFALDAFGQPEFPDTTPTHNPQKIENYSKIYTFPYIP